MKQRFARALIADENPLFAAGLEAVLKQHPSVGDIRIADSERCLMTKLREDSGFDLLLAADGLLGRPSGASIPRIVAENPGMSLVVLSDRSERVDAFAYLGAGAHGVINKMNSVTELHKAVSLVLAGHIYLPAAIRTPASAPARIAPPQHDAIPLTHRQNEILELVAIGKSNKEVARLLGIAEATVKVHLGTIYRHFGVHNRTSAVAHVHRMLTAPRAAHT